MSFLDEFSQGFNATYGRRQSRTEKAYTQAQTEHIKTSDELLREEAEREKQRYEWEKEDRPSVTAAREAATELARQDALFREQQVIEAKWLNDPEQRQRDIEATEADIEAKRAAGKLNNAQADTILAELPYAPAKTVATINNINAQTAEMEADTAQKYIDQELQYMGELTPARRLHQAYAEKYGLPPPAEGFRGATRGAVPEGTATPSRLGPPEAPTAYPYTPTVAVPRPAYTEEAPPPAPSRTVPPPAVTRGVPAGPSQPPGAIPYTAGTRAEAPMARPTPQEMQRGTPYTPPPPPREREARRPSQAPAWRPPTPEEPLPNTYRPTPQEISYRPGEGRVIEAQAGTRSLPLNDRTRSMLEQASAATGLDVRVTSGAQPSTGSKRTGSHRHDEEVGSGDVQLIDRATGKPVSMETPEGQQQIIEFMRAAREAGATGFGAGMDYMGPTTIHVGFGEPAVWGAGGKSANAPDWLKAGLEGGEGGRPSAIPEGTGARPTGVVRAYQGLQQRDIPQMQAAILAGNIQKESNGDPNSVNAGEGAEGIIQWRQDRLDKLKAFAGERDYHDLNVQLDFIIEEGERLGSEQDKAAWQEFMSATTPEAANAALKKYIRYGDESANTRLQYAENLLRSGGGEIRGEKGTTEAIGGRQRMPTPRGEVAQTVKRSTVYASANTAAREGLKAIYADFQTQPGIPTQDRQQQLRNLVANEGAASPQSLANARQAVQETINEPMSEAELNAATLAYAYDWALMVEKDPEKAQGIAKEILQAYTRTANQYAAFAKTLAQNGELDKAAQTMAKAYAYIPNGQEVTINKNEDGTYSLTKEDSATGKMVQQQILTPDQIYAGIMGWSGTADVHKELRRAAGETVPSAEFEQHFGGAAIPEGAAAGVEGGRPPSGAPVSDRINWAAMSKDEGEAARAIIKLQREGGPKAFTVEERAKIEEQIATAQGEPATDAALQVLAQLFADRPAVINGVVQDIAENSGTDVRTIISDLAHLAQSTPEAPTFQPVEQGEDTVTIHVDGSPADLTMDYRTWGTIEGALNKKFATVAANAPPDTSIRDADTAAEVEAARRAVPTIPRHPRTGQPVAPSGTSRTGQPMYSPVPYAIPSSRANPALQPEPRRYGGTGSRIGVR